VSGDQPGDELAERRTVGEAADLGLVHRPFEVAPRRVGGHVEERPGDGCHWNAVVRRDLVGEQVRAMEVNGCTGPQRSCGGYVDSISRHRQ